ncbi:MAG: class I SAM-dependent methyltransferase [Alphaproteobacteria bacterium]|jgi:SAM-dependent methyltransferase|nr:class I SAM-dependent methyltransferase [Alphaproteobacteria bacterium]
MNLKILSFAFISTLAIAANGMDHETISDQQDPSKLRKRSIKCNEGQLTELGLKGNIYGRTRTSVGSLEKLRAAHEALIRIGQKCLNDDTNPFVGEKRQRAAAEIESSRENILAINRWIEKATNSCEALVSPPTPRMVNNTTSNSAPPVPTGTSHLSAVFPKVAAGAPVPSKLEDKMPELQETLLKDLLTNTKRILNTHGDQALSLVDDVSKWTAHLNPTQLGLLIQKFILVYSIPINKGTPLGYDFGFSYCNTGVLNTALPYIYQLRAKPCTVWDVACGHGNVSLCSLVAGASEVYALDTNRYLLDHVRQEFMQTKEFFPEGARPKLRPTVFDALSLAAYAHLNSPDVIFCLNFLHYLCPREQKLVVKTLYEKLKPGGKCYLSGDSFYTSKNFTKPLLDRIREEHPTPGYCWFYTETVDGITQPYTLPEYPWKGYETNPGEIGQWSKYPGKILSIRNLLHPKPFKKMLGELGIEHVEIFYDGIGGLIPESKFNGSDSSYKLVAVLSKK